MTSSSGRLTGTSIFALVLDSTPSFYGLNIVSDAIEEGLYIKGVTLRDTLNYIFKKKNMNIFVGDDILNRGKKI
mgnify:CR=1 FL=1